MNWSLARKEWGAISFVLAVIVGVIAVPVALIFHNDSNSGVALNRPAPTISAPATSPTTSPGATSPTASPSPGG